VHELASAFGGLHWPSIDRSSPRARRRFAKTLLLPDTKAKLLAFKALLLVPQAGHARRQYQQHTASPQPPPHRQHNTTQEQHQEGCSA